MLVPANAVNDKVIVDVEAAGESGTEDSVATARQLTPPQSTLETSTIHNQFVAKGISARVLGAAPPTTFRYVDKGIMATIGRSRS